MSSEDEVKTDSFGWIITLVIIVAAVFFVASVFK